MERSHPPYQTVSLLLSRIRDECMHTLGRLEAKMCAISVGRSNRITRVFRAVDTMVNTRSTLKIRKKKYLKIESKKRLE